MHPLEKTLNIMLRNINSLHSSPLMWERPRDSSLIDIVFRATSMVSEGLNIFFSHGKVGNFSISRIVGHVTRTE